jgi:hypothetical protein
MCCSARVRHACKLFVRKFGATMGVTVFALICTECEDRERFLSQKLRLFMTTIAETPISSRSSTYSRLSEISSG